MSKKILFLVAGERQLPAIEYAKHKGYYVITCDNNPANEGHQLADEVINIDTYKHEEIYEQVKDKSIDAVVNFISEHGLITASYLVEKLNVNGLLPEPLSKLMDKGKFRELLQSNSFDTPNNKVAAEYKDNIDEGLKYPLIVKPVDRGGNVGITKVYDPKELSGAFSFAKSHAHSGEVIIEEFIQGTAVINGDCIVVDNKIISHLIGDYYYDKEVNPILPIATIFPTTVDLTNTLNQLQRLLEIINFGNGVLNFEAIIAGENSYIIEINPRHSGNLIYKLMGESMGVDFAEVSVEIACGNKYKSSDFKKQISYLAYCLIYTSESGEFEKVDLSPELKEKVIDIIIFKQAGDNLNGFNTLFDRIGLLLLKFSDREEMEYTIKNIKSFYKICSK